MNQLRYYKLKHKKLSEHQVWQEGFHPKKILTDEVYAQKVIYMHLNPVRRGYINDPAHWKYSSVGILMNGGIGVLELDELD